MSIMSSSSTAAAAAASENHEEETVCDICWASSSKWYNVKLKCTTCGLRVHQKCYQLADLTDEEINHWICWACQAVGQTVKFRERNKKTNKRLTYKMKSRPAECCLCSEPDSENMHAMHPLFDDYGSKARQIRLSNGQPAWVHTMCAVFIAKRTGGLVYTCRRDGEYTSDSEAEDSERKQFDDESSENSALKYDAGERRSKNWHHFAYTNEQWYDQNQGHIKIKNKLQKKAWKDGGCQGCKKNDVGTYRIPIQCMTGEKDEHIKLKEKSNGEPIHTDNRCSKWWHVGCARYKKIDGKYPGAQNVFFIDTGEEMLCNIFCRDCAREKFEALNEKRKRYKKGPKKGKLKPMIIGPRYPETCKVEDYEFGEAGSELSGSENEYSAASDEDYEDDDEDKNLSYNLRGEDDDNDDDDDGDDVTRRRRTDRVIDGRRKRRQEQDQEQPDSCKKQKTHPSARDGDCLQRRRKTRRQDESDCHADGHKSERQCRIQKDEHYSTENGNTSEEALAVYECNGFNITYVDKMAAKAKNPMRAYKSGRRMFRRVVSNAISNYSRAIRGSVGDGDDCPVSLQPFHQPYDPSVIGAFFDASTSVNANRDGTNAPPVPIPWCQLRQLPTNDSDDDEDGILRRFAFNSVTCVGQMSTVGEYCTECKKITEKFTAELKRAKTEEGEEKMTSNFFKQELKEESKNQDGIECKKSKEKSCAESNRTKTEEGDEKMAAKLFKQDGKEDSKNQDYPESKEKSFLELNRTKTEEEDEMTAVTLVKQEL